MVKIQCLRVACKRSADKGGIITIMKKTNLLLLSIFIMAIMMCGCGSTLPEMSENEQAYVTEYATNLLVKYSTVANRELLNEIQMEREIAEEAEERERLLKTKELEKVYLQAAEDGRQVGDDVEDEERNDAEEAVTSLPQKSVSEFFAEDSISIDYSSYDLCESYPEESSEDFFMAMDATDGHQLCIVRFAVTNQSSSDQSLDMLNKQGRFSLRMDDGTIVSAQSTLLMDDLSAYVGTIPAGEALELILVFEVPDDISQMGSMDLIMRDQSGENILTLQ